ncbi:MAG: peptidoglycan DD-metalloendopeptidase family protein [Propionibacteriaceae bacterium]|jgi:murein DD-endopeptidase MepM/ murein hydrolase activator NlpD|nr:peptidoglycan DD-metalloendopeptidase family protein [Propionibacteriaceae bacterium]
MTRFRLRLASTLGVALAVALALGAGMGSAEAGPTSISEVQAQLERYQAEQAELDRQYTDLKQALDAAQGNLARIQAERAQREAASGEVRSQVVQIMLRQYQTGGVDLGASVLGGDDLVAVVDQMATSQWLVDSDAEALRRFRLERLELTELEQAEAEAVAQIEADERRSAELLEEANQKVRDAQVVLDRLTAAEMKSLTSAKPSSLDASLLAESAGLVKPVPGARITSGFGNRSNPISGAAELHDGVDYGVACGTPVVAAAAGTVTEVRYNGGYGNRVTIDHGTIDGHRYATSYNHLASFATSVGATVDQGQVVAYSGTTGYSTGCHLHFIVWIDGGLVDGSQLVG